MGGGWTYDPGLSHGQPVVVLQLDPPEDTQVEHENRSEDANQSATEFETKNRSDSKPTPSEHTAENATQIATELERTS